MKVTRRWKAQNAACTCMARCRRPTSQLARLVVVVVSWDALRRVPTVPCVRILSGTDCCDHHAA
eukprot:7309327-Prymnesium_polylepis.1